MIVIGRAAAADVSPFERRHRGVRTRARASGGMKTGRTVRKIYAILTIASLDCCLPAMRWREFYQRQIEHSSPA